jgi:YfiH family protein
MSTQKEPKRVNSKKKHLFAQKTNMMKEIDPNFFIFPPDFPCHTFMTTRYLANALSKKPFDTFNLGTHVGDEEKDVLFNRELLQSYIPNHPIFVSQIHGSDIMSVKEHPSQLLTADGLFTDQKNLPLAILTADCLPVVITDKEGQFLSVIHAGWRGLANGIINRAISLFMSHQVNPENLFVWMGASIGPEAFEVGKEVKDIFINQHSNKMSSFFLPSPHQSNKYLGNLYEITRCILMTMGLLGDKIQYKPYCTFSDSTRFFSYRRDGQCGRMATIAWL